MSALSLFRNHKKKIMLGTSNTWLTSHLSWRTSETEYYIEDCRISVVIVSLKVQFCVITCSSIHIAVFYIISFVFQSTQMISNGVLLSFGLTAIIDF